MKTIKIFCLPSHASKDRVSGVDWARIIQPMTFLNGYVYGDFTFETYIYDVLKDTKLDWIKVAEENDLIYFNYTALPWSFAAMGAFARKYNRKMIMDLDDNLWNLQKDNPAYKAYHENSQGIKDFVSICNEVDGMTTTNLYLKNVIAHHTLKRHEQIQVFPNYIDLGLYSHRSPFKNDGQIMLTHFGSTTHFNDLENKEFENGVDMIMKEYPNVTLRTVGALLPAYKWKWGVRYENDFGHPDVLHWIKDPDKFARFMEETDILVTPLVDNIYNRCKSSIKFLEGSSAVKPGCWQRIRQYEQIVKDGENGFLCQTAGEWYNSIKKLIDDPKLRKDMGAAAFQTVEDSWRTQDHIEDYARYFVDIFGK